MFILMGVFFQIKSPALRDDISPGKHTKGVLFDSLKCVKETIHMAKTYFCIHVYNTQVL